ncbi:MAG: efflux RND transporter periplasmic adaptor subunit [Verrucomicrobiae bacterium]|nr:efflux RND transporter periplasmic adaptor subunit [Verrucomicrobiae bacterium]
MKRSFRILVAVAILLSGVLLFVGLAGMKSTPLPSNPPKPVPEVETLTARKNDLTVNIPAQGVVEPVTVTRASAEVEGVIVEVAETFEAGGIFRAGDLLLRIDPSDYEAAVAQAGAALADAKLNLAEEEQRALQAERDWKRLATAGSQPGDFVLRVPHLEAARARVVSAEAALERARLDLRRTELRPLYDGRIRSKLADLGTRVGKGEDLAEFYDTDVLEVRLPIPRQDAAFLDGAGQTIELREHGGTRTWSATVDRTEGEIRRDDRTIVVVARIDGGVVGSPLPGQFVETEIPGRIVPGIIRVPRRAFVASDRVLVVTPDQTIATRPVTILRTEREDVLVSSGIEDGEQLCVTALAAVIEGMEVKVVSRDGQAVLASPSVAP